MSSESKYIVWVVCDLARDKITTIFHSVSVSKIGKDYTFLSRRVN